MIASTVPITIIPHVPILLSDGTTLSAKIWLPRETATRVPAVFEYLPYRKSDGTAHRDALNHRYFAAHGYACVRVDLRGSGDSEGVMHGEYLKQELDDGLEVLRWIARQPWCTGAVGMIGISWGGFNGLQIAALRPPELKAVISICSTDDRYDNDVHYMGGSLLVDNFLWGTTMLAINGTPPDPAIVGENWRDMWLERLETEPYMDEWHRRQRRDSFWQHASICEDYSAIQCPVYLVGGFRDPYHNSIFRMMDKLKCPKKGLVGPWAHKYPNFAKPGPQIGFLQESIRWWDKWLKGVETGVMDEPTFRCYLQDTAGPQTHYNFRPGHWVAEESWPSQNVTPTRMNLSMGRISVSCTPRNEKLSICSPQTVGFAAGRWISYGIENDEPHDQRAATGGSLIFDSQPTDHPLTLLGAPVVDLEIASDKPIAHVAAVLSEILPDGSITKLSYGILNLTHRHGHLHPQALEPGQFYRVSVQLIELGQTISPGSRIRLALSSSYFPIIWPSPSPVTLTINCACSSIVLPIRSPNHFDKILKPFEPAVNGEPLDTTVLRPPRSENSLTQDLSTGRVTLLHDSDEGLCRINESGWRFGERETISCSVTPDEPLSAVAEQRFRKEFGRDKLVLITEGSAKMQVTEKDLLLTARVDAWEGQEQVFGKDYTWTIPRDHN
jgi:putative CocE/NonD family hydrolase